MEHRGIESGLTLPLLRIPKKSEEYILKSNSESPNFQVRSDNLKSTIMEGSLKRGQIWRNRGNLYEAIITG